MLNTILEACASPSPEAYATIAMLLGKPITVYPPQQPSKSAVQICNDLLAQIYARQGSYRDNRRFRHVLPNARRENSKIGQRYAMIREGMTVGEYLNKGGRRKDIRGGLRRGFFVLEGK